LRSLESEDPTAEGRAGVISELGVCASGEVSYQLERFAGFVSCDYPDGSLEE
jgi:hypothetical protein